MKLVVDLDIRKNDIAFSLFLISTFCLFIYSTTTIYTDNIYLLNFLIFIILVSTSISEDRNTKTRGKNISRAVSLIFLGILIFFQGSINKPMLIFLLLELYTLH